MDTMYIKNTSTIKRFVPSRGNRKRRLFFTRYWFLPPRAGSELPLFINQWLHPRAAGLARYAVHRQGAG